MHWGTMMTNRDMDDLDDLLALAKARPVTPGDDLMARVLADAAAQQSPARVRTGSPSGTTRWLQDLLGGWPVLTGILAAGLSGLWIGVAPPAGVEGLAAVLVGTTQSVTFLPETDLTLFEDPTDG